MPANDPGSSEARANATSAVRRKSAIATAVLGRNSAAWPAAARPMPTSTRRRTSSRLPLTAGRGRTRRPGLARLHGERLRWQLPLTREINACGGQTASLVKHMISKPKLIRRAGVSPSQRVGLVDCQPGGAAARELGSRGRCAHLVRVCNYVTPQFLKCARITHRGQRRNPIDHGQFTAPRSNRRVALGDTLNRGLKRLWRDAFSQSEMVASACHETHICRLQRWCLQSRRHPVYRRCGQGRCPSPANEPRIRQSNPLAADGKLQNVSVRT